MFKRFRKNGEYYGWNIEYLPKNTQAVSKTGIVVKKYSRKSQICNICGYNKKKDMFTIISRGEKFYAYQMKGFYGRGTGFKDEYRWCLKHGIPDKIIIIDYRYSIFLNPEKSEDNYEKRIEEIFLKSLPGIKTNGKTFIKDGNKWKIE